MENRNLTITGYAFPTEWDKHGNVIEIAILTDSFEKYIVTCNTKAKQLLNYLDDQVCVKGMVTREDSVGNKVIKIMKFNALNKGKEKLIK